MSDQLLERRLRAALHDEADALLITITPAELERRAALRRRSLWGGRRLTLLFAAAVATSLLLVAGGLSGVFRQAVIAPTMSPLASVTPSPAASTGPVSLPDLDALVAADPAAVIVAQAHGPADGPADTGPRTGIPAPHIDLGTLPGGFEYRVSYACRAAGSMELQLVTPSFGGLSAVVCDGAMHEQAVSGATDTDLRLAFADDASWRVVVRGPAWPDQQGPILTIPPAGPGREELVRWDGNALDSGATTLRDTGLLVQAAGAVPTRPGYRFDLMCTAGGPVHLIIGDTGSAGIDARTETVVACDPTDPRSVDVGAAEPFGGQIFIAARPDQQVSLLVTSPTPPVAVATPQPGWVLVQAVGPSLDYGTNGYSLSDAVGSHIQVAIACTGTQPIVVSVDDSYPLGGGVHVQTFTATCTPDGSETRHTFTVRKTGVIVSYTAPAGIWSALSLLAPG